MFLLVEQVFSGFLVKISKGMVASYINYITSYFILDRDEPPEKLDDCYSYALRIKAQATKRKDLEPLRLGIDYLLCHSEIDLDSHGGIYPFDDDEVRQILYYIRSVVWSDKLEVNCEEVKDVELLNTTNTDWWKTRGVKP